VNVKRNGLAILSLLVAAALVAAPAVHAKKQAHHGVSCKQIKDAMASGKSADDVVKDMKTTQAHVKSCTTPTQHHAKKKSTKAS
jgi:hypothetical protein